MQTNTLVSHAQATAPESGQVGLRKEIRQMTNITKLGRIVAISAALVLAVMGGSATAATISVVNTDSAYTGTNSSPKDFSLSNQGPGTRDGIYSYNYSAGASFDVLVVTVSREASSASQNGGDTFAVTYANENMVLATGDTSGSGVTIYYLPTSTQSGTIALDFTGFATVNGIGIGIAAIKSNTSDPVTLTDANSGTGTSIGLTPIQDGSFTIFAVDTNGGGFGGTSNSNNLANAANLDVQIAKVTDIGSNGFGVAYDSDVSVDTIQYSYYNTNDPRGIAVANFSAIPEPSTMILAGLGLMGLCFRRGRGRTRRLSLSACYCFPFIFPVFTNEIR